MDEIQELKDRLLNYYERFRRYMRTKTRDTSEYGWHYLSGLLRMKESRNMANIARQTAVAEQNMQQFISDSPWSAAQAICAIQTDISEREEFQVGSILVLDESAEVKNGAESAGSSRQYNGRLGKVEQSVVGVFLSLVNNGYHTWIDGELFLADCWFTPDYAAKRKRVGLPAERRFETKPELGLKMVKRAQENGVPFEAVTCDTLYGRNGWLRDQLQNLQIEYYADVPENITVYLQPPLVSWSRKKGGQRTKKPEIITPAYTVAQLAQRSHTEWHTFSLRPNERGHLTADFAAYRVWTVRPDGSTRTEWLLIRRDLKKHTYSLSNANVEASLLTMAQRKSQRYFIERSNQDAKSELGWDEFQALKYRAWEHHLAFTILASWFVTETKLDWRKEHPPSPDLLEVYQTDTLPNLSVANVRTLLQAAMPLPQLSSLEATQLVIKHLDNRVRSRKSRLKNALSP